VWAGVENYGRLVVGTVGWSVVSVRTYLSAVLGFPEGFEDPRDLDPRPRQAPTEIRALVIDRVVTEPTLVVDPEELHYLVLNGRRSSKHRDLCTQPAQWNWIL